MEIICEQELLWAVARLMSISSDFLFTSVINCHVRYCTRRISPPLLDALFRRKNTGWPRRTRRKRTRRILPTPGT